VSCSLSTSCPVPPLAPFCDSLGPSLQPHYRTLFATTASADFSRTLVPEISPGKVQDRSPHGWALRFATVVVTPSRLALCSQLDLAHAGHTGQAVHPAGSPRPQQPPHRVSGATTDRPRPAGPNGQSAYTFQEPVLSPKFRASDRKR
jgi:hypothetical protein